jgi:ribulose-phosphate 3-epimerase
VFPYHDVVDVILAMPVEPGFGGAQFMSNMMEKVRKIRESNAKLDMQVDGRVNLETIDTAAEAGANCIVVGAIFRTRDPHGMMTHMQQSVKRNMERQL